MNIKEVRQWETIVSPTEDCSLNIGGSIIQETVKDKYAITGFPYNTNREMMFVLTEYNEDMYPRCGFCSYVVTKDELENNFDIVGKYKSEYQ